MNNLTLIIPAKNEKESLPKVLEELKKYSYNISVVLEESDTETINAIKNFSCRIIFQNGKGFGDALIQGIKETQTEFFCIFNADGSFNPIELKAMLKKVQDEPYDFVFATRYEKDCGSDDDTIVTFIGNYIFTFIGKIFFKLKISDILYTFVLGRTEQAKQLNLKYKDFSFCVELPIKAKRKGYTMTTSKSYERSRIAGEKKVNAIRDGILIFLSIIKLFFKSN
tara:strand:+ start:4155 stop:4826 length:672 start_codon:yes stop_codon:yes gene_type:complete